jgi:hypothetical protein
LAPAATDNSIKNVLPRPSTAPALGNSGAEDSMGVGDNAGIGGSISDARVGGAEDGDRFGADGHDGAFLAMLPSTSLALGDIPFAETTARMIVENRGSAPSGELVVVPGQGLTVTGCTG